MSRIFALKIIVFFAAICMGQAMFLLPSEHGIPLVASYNYRIIRSDSSATLMIFVELTNNSLQFIKSCDRYQARYRIDAAAYRDKELLQNNSSTDSVFAESFASTNKSESWSAGTVSLTLPEGKYRIFLSVTDLNAKTRSRTEFDLNVPNFKEIKLTHPWFFVPETDSMIISSTVPANWDSIGIAANVYDIPENASCQLIISGIRYRPRQYKGKFSISGNETLAVAFFPISEMTGGEYDAELKLISPKGNRIASSKISFTVKQTQKSMSEYHYDELLKQFELIASPSDILELENADSSFRDSLLENFWRKRDPTPNTDYNEFKEEFFRRVQYVNETYGTATKQGWQTDRGRVYITCGQPDEIERHPFELDSLPYEIWYYYSLGYTFIFVDTFGDGDYKLKERK